MITDLTKKELREAIEHLTRLIDTGVDYRNGEEIPKHILPVLFVIRHDYEKELNSRNGI